MDEAVIVTEAGALDRRYPQDWYLMLGLMAAWAGLAGVLLALAASGVYALMAFTVAQRTREIGIRTALGARPRHVLATVGRRAALQIGAGALLGMPLAGRAFQMVKEDPRATGATLAAAVVPGVAVVVVVGVLACAVPLRRVLAIRPTEAMRSG